MGPKDGIIKGLHCTSFYDKCKIIIKETGEYYQGKPKSQAPRGRDPRTKLNRGSYRSAHVLLNLLNELRKRDKMRGLQRV